MWSSLSCLLQSLEAGFFDRLDLIHNEAETRHVPLHLRQCVWRKAYALWRAKRD